MVAIAASAPFLLKGLIALLNAATKRIQSGTDVKSEELALIKWYREELDTRTEERDIALAHVARQRETLQEYENAEKKDSSLQERIDALIKVNKELEQQLQDCQDARPPTSPTGDAHVYINDPLRGETDL